MPPKRTTPRICEVCAVPFLALDKSAGRFCSRACTFIGAKRKPRSPLNVPSACAQCGTTFYAYQGRLDLGRRFCSRACYGLYLRVPVDLRLARGIDRSNADGCWPWIMARDRKGYGAISVNGKRMAAHRLSWASVNGPIPVGHGVHHRCDNPPCCRPDHLFTGPQADNVADMVAKKRHRNTSRQVQIGSS